MHKLITLIASLLLLNTGAQAGPVEAEALKRVAEGALLLDVRTPGEYAAGHLEKAENIPYQNVVAALQAKGVTKDTAIVLYCRSGNRSGIAQRMLTQAGYNNLFNGGGLAALQRQQQAQ